MICRSNVSLTIIAIVSAILPVGSLPAEDRTSLLDPSAWGSDHVGEPVPEFVSGDQCLFCHRKEIGPAWTENRHGLTIRVATKDSAAIRSLRANGGLQDYAETIEYLLGTGSHQRFLKRGESYGQLELLSVKWSEDRTTDIGRLTDTHSARWQPTRFSEACAGCHTTGVDAATGRFTAISLDCFVCHGDPSDEHTEDGSLVRLSPAQDTPAREVMSICGQCHLRGGRSKSSGRPYANNFVPGDNLFRDFEIDLSDQAISNLGPADGHVFKNIRDVVQFGREESTCLSCHDVHRQSTKQHQELSDSQLCWQCHKEGRPKSVVKSIDGHSSTCEY